MRIFIFARSAGGTALRGSFVVVTAASGSFGGNSTIQITALTTRSIVISASIIRDGGWQDAPTLVVRAVDYAGNVLTQ